MDKSVRGGVASTNLGREDTYLISHRIERIAALYEQFPEISICRQTVEIQDLKSV